MERAKYICWKCGKRFEMDFPEENEEEGVEPDSPVFCPFCNSRAEIEA